MWNVWHGTKARPGSGLSKCSVCKGSGRIGVRKGPFFIET